MEITVFAKSKTTKEGKPFSTYFGKLTKKDGSEISTEIKFTQDAGTPSKFPCNIIVNHEDANLTEKNVTYTKDGVEKEAIQRRLWISAWREGQEYIDHSLDEFI